MDDLPPAVPGKRRVGRPRFEATTEQRNMVTALKGCGIDHPTIADLVRVPLRTLEKYFKAEIAQGKERVKARIGLGLVQRALAGDNTAAIFYMKTQGGWTTRHEVTGPEGGPIDLGSISLDSLTAALEAFGKGEGAGADGGGSSPA